jgi:hypothetical protein
MIIYIQQTEALRLSSRCQLDWRAGCLSMTVFFSWMFAVPSSSCLRQRSGMLVSLGSGMLRNKSKPFRRLSTSQLDLLSGGGGLETKLGNPHAPREGEGKSRPLRQKERVTKRRSEMRSGLGLVQNSESVQPSSQSVLCRQRYQTPSVCC